MSPAAREGLVAVEREVSRSTGETHTQRFWVRREDLKDTVRADPRLRVVASSNAPNLTKLTASERKRTSWDRAPPIVKSAARSLLQDAGGLSAALEAIQNSKKDDLLIDPVSKQPTTALRVRNALEALRPQPLPKNEEYVTVHHATDAASAATILKDGLIPELKPHTLASERYEKGEAATFSPGSGLSRGTYVAEPGKAESYGRVVLELKIPKSYLEVSPEQTTLGVTDAGESLKTHDGAVITKPIPPSAIRDVAAPRFTFEKPLPAGIHEPVAAALTTLLDTYPEISGLKINMSELSGTGVMALGGKTSITLNTQIWDDPAKLAEHEKAWTGLVIDATPAGTVVHEVGHVMSKYVHDQLGDDDFDRIITKHAPDHGSLSSPSVYGQESPGEFLAESFSARHFGHHANRDTEEMQRYLAASVSLWDELISEARKPR